MKGSTLLASAPTLDKVRERISEFYMGSNVALIQFRPDAWTVATGRGHLPSVVVRLAKDRYRFERLPEGTTIASPI